MRNQIEAGFISIKFLIIIVIVVVVGLAVLLGFSSGQAQARDEHRLKDIQQVAQVFQIYYQENGFYPYAGVDGTPQGLSDYLQFWPTAPTKDGQCTVAQNQYNYQQKSLGQDFQVTFCLGSSGTHTLTPNGIQ